VAQPREDSSGLRGWFLGIFGFCKFRDFAWIFAGDKKQEVVKIKIEIENSAKPQNLETAEGLADNGPEETFFFVFVCKGPKSAYKTVEEYIKGRTTARVIFQRISKNYMVVSELQTRLIGVVKDGP
jgi:hypothetical protein